MNMWINDDSNIFYDRLGFILNENGENRVAVFVETTYGDRIKYSAFKNGIPAYFENMADLKKFFDLY